MYGISFEFQFPYELLMSFLTDHINNLWLYTAVLLQLISVYGEDVGELIRSTYV